MFDAIRLLVSSHNFTGMNRSRLTKYTHKRVLDRSTADAVGIERDCWQHFLKKLGLHSRTRLWRPPTVNLSVTPRLCVLDHNHLACFITLSLFSWAHQRRFGTVNGSCCVLNIRACALKNSSSVSMGDHRCDKGSSQLNNILLSASVFVFNYTFEHTLQVRRGRIWIMIHRDVLAEYSSEQPVSPLALVLIERGVFLHLDRPIGFRYAHTHILYPNLTIYILLVWEGQCNYDMCIAHRRAARHNGGVPFRLIRYLVSSFRSLYNYV